MIRTRFSSLQIGTVLEFLGVEFVKIGNNIPSEKLPLNKQNPNCLNLKNGHYCVIGAKAIVNVIKTPDNFESDYYDLEKK